MNYQELSGYAMSMDWAVKLLDVVKAKNVEILAQRQRYLDNREGIQAGDLIVSGEKLLRVAHDWGDAVQLTDGRFGQSFYLGQDFVSFSGGLDPSIDKTRFRPTGRRENAAVWFFSENHHEANNGYHTRAKFAVWELIPA